jgi:hypothetical protein
VHSGLRLDAAAATGAKTGSADCRAGYAADAARASAIAAATVITSATGSAFVTAGKIRRSAAGVHPEAQTADTCRGAGAEHSAQGCSSSGAAAAGRRASGGAPA